MSFYRFLSVVHLSLIFRKEDRLFHKNWRPISLLNVDFKLCARVLADRLLKVMHLVSGLFGSVIVSTS